MKCTPVLLCILLTFYAEVTFARSFGSGFGEYAKGYYRGAKEMFKAYNEMKKVNVIGADKYFHAKGNFNAAKHGPGGYAAAKHLSDLREATDKIRFLFRIPPPDRTSYYNYRDDSDKDQEANRWGRSGGDPNKYRVKGIPDDY